MRTAMLALLAAACSLGLCASAAPPSEDLVSLIQTRTLEVEEEEEVSEISDDKIMSPEAALDLDEEQTVDSLVKTTQRLLKDIRISIDMNGPKIKSKVTEKDLKATKELHTWLEAQLREIKLVKMAINVYHQKPKKMDPEMVRMTINSLKSNLYSPYNETAYLMSGNKAFCIQGPTYYMKNVLRRLRDSPLMYGFPQEKTWLDRGACTENGYATPGPDSSCFRQTSVWLDGNARHKKLYDSFNDDMVLKWTKLQKSNHEVARKEFRRLCIKS